LASNARQQNKGSTSGHESYLQNSLLKYFEYLQLKCLTEYNIAQTQEAEKA
jgi:hypothetical protein